MFFDKNQIKFLTPEHKQVWSCGILVLPEELVLSDKVKVLMSADLFESCKQMRLFILHSLQDIYENIDNYYIDPKKYLHFWFDLIDISRSSGIFFDDTVIIDSVKWKNLIDKKIDRYYENIFVNTGIQINLGKKSVEIKNSIYPKMFFAMKEMVEIVRASKEKISLDNSFHYCDFRKLCPTYKYEKHEKSKKLEIEDRISSFLDGEMKTTALAFVEYLREKKMPPKSATMHSWKVNFKGETICSISITNNEWCVWSYVWYTKYITPEYQAEFENFVLNENLQEFIWDGLYACVAYHPQKGGGCCHPEKSCAGGQTKVVFGKEFKNMCIARDTFFYDPDNTAIENIKKVINFRGKTLEKIKA